jgi:hypothetical protein
MDIIAVVMALIVPIGSAKCPSALCSGLGHEREEKHPGIAQGSLAMFSK